MSSSANSPAASAAARSRSEQRRGQRRREERPAGPGPDGAGGAGEHAEAGAARPPATRHTSSTAREPMCFSSHTTSATPVARGRRRRPGPGARAGRRRDAVATGLMVGGRYSSQRGSIANRLITSSAAAACASRIPTRGRYAVSITRDPETSPMSSTSGSRRPAAGRRRAGHRGERLGRGVVDAGGGDRDQRPFGILERGETATEHAAGVHAQGVVQPLRGRHRGVAVHHDGAAPVLGRPRVADRQAVLVGLAGGLPVQAELADPARGAAVVALDQAGVRHHQAARRPARSG